MDAKLIIIIGFSYLYGLFEVVMNLRQRGKGAVTTFGDKGSLRLLYALITLGYALSFAIGATRIGRMAHWNVFFAVGVVTVLAGLTIRVRSILTLKQVFTYSVAQTENHPLIETGPYRIIRHPGYLGQLMVFAGIAVSLSNWLAVLLMMVPIAIGYGYRIRVEEDFMIEHMGASYLSYRKRTKRLIPLIY